MNIITRSKWHAAPADGDMMRQNVSDIDRAFIHYTDNEDAPHLRSLDAQAAALRGIQRFHLSKWSDIGYHFIVFQPYGLLPRARAFEGRAITNVPAAQQGSNTNTLTIAVYAGPDDNLKRNTRYIIESLIKRYPTIKRVGGHRDVFATECPGDRIYVNIPLIARACGIRTYK